MFVFSFVCSSIVCETRIGVVSSPEMHACGGGLLVASINAPRLCGTGLFSRSVFFAMVAVFVSSHAEVSLICGRFLSASLYVSKRGAY